MTETITFVSPRKPTPFRGGRNRRSLKSSKSRGEPSVSAQRGQSRREGPRFGAAMRTRPAYPARGFVEPGRPDVCGNRSVGAGCSDVNRPIVLRRSKEPRPRRETWKCKPIAFRGGQLTFDPRFSSILRGDVRLTLSRRVRVRLTGRAKVSDADLAHAVPVPFYLARCPIHGYYVTCEHGWERELPCPECEDIRISKMTGGSVRG